MTPGKEIRIAFLRPREIAERLEQCPLVYLPIGPLEWHGPHLAFGMDPLNAENTALETCKRTGGIVWPTQFWGTERERPPRQLESLGFSRDRYVVGMDFPNNALKSMYCPEEILALLVREILREIITLGAKVCVIVNGHGAENQIATLKRLEVEFTNTSPLRVLFRIAAPRAAIEAGSGEHAAAQETSVLMAMHPECVDLSELPPAGRPIRYVDSAVVDGPGFDGKGPGEGCLSEACDPRKSASAEAGRKYIEATVTELAAEVGEILRVTGAKHA